MAGAGVPEASGAGVPLASGIGVPVGTTVPSWPGVAVAVIGSMGVPFIAGVAVTTTPPVVPWAGVAGVVVPGSEHPTSPNRRLAAATVKSVFFTINLLLPNLGHTSTDFSPLR